MGNDTMAPKWLMESKSIKVLLYIFVLNGISFYATWTVIATLLNIGAALHYKGGMGEPGTSVFILVILFLLVFFYWFLDFYRFKNHLRYTYTPHVVLIFAFAGIEILGPIIAFFVIGFLLKIAVGVCGRNNPGPLQSV